MHRPTPRPGGPRPDPRAPARGRPAAQVSTAKFFWPVRSVAGVEGWDGRRPETALGAFTKFESRAILIDRARGLGGGGGVRASQ